MPEPKGPLNLALVDALKLVSDRITQRLGVAAQFQIELRIKAVDPGVTQEEDVAAGRGDAVAGRAADLVGDQLQLGDRRVDGKAAAVCAGELGQRGQPDALAGKDQGAALNPRMHGDNVVAAPSAGAEALPEGVVEIGVEVVADRHLVTAVRNDEAVLDIGRPRHAAHLLVGRTFGGHTARCADKAAGAGPVDRWLDAAKAQPRS